MNTFLGNVHLRLFGDSSGLIVLTFHGVVAETKDLSNPSLDPRFLVTLDQFREAVLYFLSAGFQAVSPADVLRGLPRGRRHVLFTFDDGYANNLQVLPVLEGERVPALFALATDYVVLQKAYWWDVLRQRSGEHWDLSTFNTEVNSLFQENPTVIEMRLVDRFGADILHSPNELARPMLPAEVRNLAKHPLVFWANHTARHDYLPALDEDEIRGTVGRAQEALHELTGSRPLTMVYPYGGHNKCVRRICWDLGLRLGFTMGSYKQSFSLAGDPERAMTIPRFAVYHEPSIHNQCLETRINWKPSWLLRGHPARRTQD